MKLYVSVCRISVLVLMLSNSITLFGDPTKKLIDSLFQRLRNPEDDSVKVYTLISLSTVYGLSDLKRAVGYAESAVRVAENSGAKRLQALSLIYCGTVYYNMGILDAATNCFTRYDKLVMETGDKQKMALSKINLGAVWLSLEDYEKAKKLHIEALQLLKEYAADNKQTTLSPSAINIYNNLSGIYREQKNFTKALEYSDLGIALARKTPNYYKILDMLLDNRAKLMILQGNFTEALKAYDEVVEINKRENDKVGLASTFVYLGELYDKQKVTDKAINYYKEAYQLSVETDNIKTIHNAATLLYKLYEKTGPADSALKYVSISNLYEQKINRQKADENFVVHELTVKYQEREKIRKADYQRKLIILWISAGLILVLAISAFLLFLRARKKERKTQLEKMNTELASRKLVLEKELLQAELELKDKQLATSVIYKIQKNEMIEDVVKHLLDSKESFKMENQEIIGSVINELGKTKEETVWNEFEIRFQQVHQSFYTNLSRNFPDLTPNERRLCAFLRLNMSTKEISTITGQSLHSINVARTRLRKKLSLTNTEKGLIEFLATL